VRYYQNQEAALIEHGAIRLGLQAAAAAAAAALESAFHLEHRYDIRRTTKRIALPSPLG